MAAKINSLVVNGEWTMGNDKFNQVTHSPFTIDNNTLRVTYQADPSSQ